MTYYLTLPPQGQDQPWAPKIVLAISKPLLGCVYHFYVIHSLAPLMSNHVGILHWSLWNSSEVMDLNRLSNVPCIANFRGPLPIFFLIFSHKLNFLVSCFVVSTILFQLQYFSSHRLRLNFGNISFQNWHLKSSYLGLNFETLKFSSLGLNFGN